MTARTRQLGLAIFCCGLVLAPATWAFFPIGGYDTGGVLRLKQYNRSFFDNNNDGVIDEDEGIPVYIEDGKSGFTIEEMAIVREALRIWERVPQSYAATSIVGEVQDPIFTGQDTFDTLNVIAIQVTSTQDLDGDGNPDEGVEPDDIIVPDLAGGVVGVNVFFFAQEETVIQSGTDSYIVSSGTIIDNDIIVSADFTRPAAAGEAPAADLLSTLVHEIGHFYGLTHTALNNLDAQVDADGLPTGGLLESTVLSHSIGGVSRRIGVTPTMYPVLFEVIDGNGARVGGGADLAPDDISGISWLYPRGSQDLFFGLTGEVRTRTNAGLGLPSAPIPGGHVVAWADVDNDPTTPRVAVFSTLTALYVNSGIYPEREGRFVLSNIWKTMETESDVFNATYTFSNNPLNFTGYERQAPPNQDPTVLDSIEPPALGFNNAFPSEVLHEAGNIIDISNKDAGTSFIWDFRRQTLVSSNTDRSIESIVGSGPMFGDPNDVCIFNVVSGAGTGGGVAGSIVGAKSVRSLRDAILLDTALGSFIVDTYYSVSPTLARFILGNSVAYSLTARTVGLAYWCLDHLLLVAGFVGACLWLVRRRQRRMAGGALISGVLMLLMIGSTADALIIHQTTEDLTANATDIISGTVTSAVARQSTSGSRIYTDVVIAIDGKAKGPLNKQSTITFTQMGGRVGGLVMEVSEIPKFTKGESVVVFLEYVEGFGYRVYNGIGGKKLASVNASTGKKTVAVVRETGEKLKSSNGGTAPTSLSLDDYMAHLRAIVKKQAAAAK